MLRIEKMQTLQIYSSSIEMPVVNINVHPKKSRSSIAVAPRFAYNKNQNRVKDKMYLFAIQNAFFSLYKRLSKKFLHYCYKPIYDKACGR